MTGTVRWQSCDDDVCHLPRTERFTIDVPAAPHDRPESELSKPGGMDVGRHLKRLVSRRTDKSLAEVFQNITGTTD